MSALPSVSVVVPVFDQEAILPITLPAITALEGVAEIVFVNDGSGDASPELLDRAVAGHPRARVIHHPENRGRAAARNTGIGETTGEVILFLDADIIPEPNTAAAHARRYLDDAVIGVLSNDHPDALDRRDPFHRYLLDTAGPRGVTPDEPLHFKYFIAGYSTVRRAALDEVGAFDERIGYGEDLDLAYRLTRRWPAGLRFEPAAVVHQRNVGDLGQRRERLRAFGRDLRILMEKHPTMAREAHIQAVTSRLARALLRPTTSRMAQFLLRRSPARLQPRLVRLILAAAVAEGYRERGH